MFHAIVPTPTVYTIPLAMVDTDTYQIELGSVESAQFKTSSLLLRIHTGLTNVKLKLIAYTIWPYSNDAGLRFQDGTPVMTTAESQGGSGDNGVLLTHSPVTICSPALRIVIGVTATGAVAAGAEFAIAAGMVLHVD